jgi:hypothetical protein
MTTNTKPEDLNPDGTPKTPDTSGTQNTPPAITPEVQALIQAETDKQLKQMKDNVDKAYKAKEAAEARATALETEKRNAEIARLTEEGKHREAFELQLKEEKALREAAEKRNVELTRDLGLRNALGAYEFRNANALEMAYREIVPNLIQDAAGQWVHKSGVSITESVKTFVSHEDNAFLLKTKASTGGGSQQPARSGDTSKKKVSLFEMDQNEVLALAAEGKLRNR